VFDLLFAETSDFLKINLILESKSSGINLYFIHIYCRNQNLHFFIKD